MLTQTEFKSATVKNLGDIECAYGEYAQVIIDNINRILCKFPVYDGLSKGGNPLKRQTAAALKKANKAKKHIEDAMKLLAEIENTHRAISETILDVYDPCLAQKVRAELNNIAKENEYLTQQRQQDFLSFLGINAFNLDSMLKLISRSLDCSFWEGRWNTTPSIRNGIDEYLIKEIEKLWQAIEQCDAIKGKMTKARFVEVSIGGNEKTMSRFNERKPLARHSRTK